MSPQAAPYMLHLGVGPSLATLKLGLEISWDSLAISLYFLFPPISFVFMWRLFSSTLSKSFGGRGQRSKVKVLARHWSHGFWGTTLQGPSLASLQDPLLALGTELSFEHLVFSDTIMIIWKNKLFDHIATCTIFLEILSVFLQNLQ